MKNFELDYQLPPSTWFKRMLWACAGGDRFLLERSTYSDQVKYMCLGGIVLATGLMAGLSGGYAFYTIFSPRTNALSDNIDIPTVLKSIVFGFIWGLIILNIDRFIVAATGKGDGTEKITWQEFVGAIPRIIMGSIIAITISKPMEIRMFQTEINNKLYEKQLILQKDFEKRTTANFEERLKLVDRDLGDIYNLRQDIQNRLKKAEQAYQDNLMGRAGNIGAGNGPLSKALKREKEEISEEIERFDNLNRTKLDAADKKKKDILAEKEKALATNKEVAEGLDGLLERIKLSHEVAGFWITLFITLLFLAIELTPVFFKLMLIKSPYDYLKDNLEDEVRAQHGIEVKYDYYKDKKGMERHLVINHDAANQMYEKEKLSDVQRELTDYAIQKYKEREMQNIDENLDEYIVKKAPHILPKEQSTAATESTKQPEPAQPDEENAADPEGINPGAGVPASEHSNAKDYLAQDYDIKPENIIVGDESDDENFGDNSEIKSENLEEYTKEKESVAANTTAKSENISDNQDIGSGEFIADNDGLKTEDSEAENPLAKNNPTEGPQDHTEDDVSQPV